MKTINTKTATHAQLVREIHHLRRKNAALNEEALSSQSYIETQRQTYEAQLDSLRAKYNESEGARRGACERVIELARENKNLCQCIVEMARTTKGLAEVIEHL